jgi:hypothetical protein
MKIGTRGWIISGFCFLYIPFAVFSIGFLRPEIGIPAAFIVGILLLRYLHRLPQVGSVNFPVHEIWIAAALIVCWVLLSGVGGYAFQNCDHHIRNAIFHDLVEFDWPVRYASDSSALVYYIGYWLPSALMGKLFGWNFAEFFLFLWTGAGIGITVFLLLKVVKASPVKMVLFFLLFSGMDAIGVLLDNILIQGFYPGFWPPMTHLEWWAWKYQFSSFTTQLFWVFNQAVPVWVCMAIHLAAPDGKRGLLLWSLCFFLAPIPSIGFLPFILLEFPQKLFQPGQLRFPDKPINLSKKVRDLWSDVRGAFTPENVIAGGIILSISAAYFSSNPMSSKIEGTLLVTPMLLFFPFVLLEGLLLWILLLEKMRHNLEWYAAGILLLVCPLIRIGTSIDFCMRASIPALCILMAGTANGLADRQLKFRPLLLLMLLVGAITPIYEINRSVYRSAVYYANQSTLQSQPTLDPQEATFDCQPETDHPNTLTADKFQSLANLDPEQIPNFIADIENSLYEKYLENKSD